MKFLLCELDEEEEHQASKFEKRKKNFFHCELHCTSPPPQNVIDLISFFSFFYTFKHCCSSYCCVKIEMKLWVESIMKFASSNSPFIFQNCLCVTNCSCNWQ